MPRRASFEVLSWDDLPEGHEVNRDYDLMCVCGREAIVPVAVGGVIEARIGMGFVCDPLNLPPPFYIPGKIKCRKCGRIYERPEMETPHVR